MMCTFNARRFVLSLMWSILAYFVLFTVVFHRSLPAQTPALTRFTVMDAGTAGKPDVILIPGLDSSRDVWDAEVKLLAPNYRLHLVQVNGFAGAPAGANASGAMLPGIVDELHLYIGSKKMRPFVVGHSLGGTLALMLAEQHPADVQKLVLVDSLPFYSKIFGADATVDNIRPKVDAIAKQFSGMTDAQWAAMGQMIGMQMVTDAEGQKAVAAASAASDRTVGTKAMLEDMLTDLRPGLAAATVPTLMLYPLDATQKAEEVDALYHDAYTPMPHVTLKRIDNSKHFIMYDQPAQFDATLQAFLK